MSSFNPLDAIEVGVHPPARRIDAERRPWNPAERVDLATMIAMYTINAAYANHAERETGSIEIGKLADLVVLDRNLFVVPDRGDSHRHGIAHAAGGKDGLLG